MPPFASGHRTFIRSVYAETLLENFFVAAIASVLAIRLYLRLTGYPQLGSGEFHIAHVLWGGLLMLIGIVMSLTFLNRSAREIAAVVGGVGFGAFIDELGKFVTSNSDYFFQPTVALIYVVFVLLYLAIRIIARRQPLARDDLVGSVFELTSEAAIHGISAEEQHRVMILLQECPDDVIRQHLNAILLSKSPSHTARPPLTVRFKRWTDTWYEYSASKWWFTGAVIGFFALVSITSLYTLVAAVAWSVGLALGIGGAALIVAALFLERRRRLHRLYPLVVAAIIVISIGVTWALLVSLKVEPFSLLNWAGFIFPCVSGIITVIGLVLMPDSRLRAYRVFRLNILVSIFLTQVLAFYQSQFFALIGLLADIVILLALRYMINHEEGKRNGVSDGR